MPLLKTSLQERKAEPFCAGSDVVGIKSSAKQMQGGWTLNRMCVALFYPTTLKIR
jgi:hypothetical protein